MTSADARGDGHAYDQRTCKRTSGRTRDARVDGRVCTSGRTSVSVRTCVDTFTRHVRPHVRK